MAKITTALWKDKRTSRSDSPIALVIQHERKRATLMTGFRAKPKSWNSRTGEVRKTYGDDWIDVNQRLRDIRTEAEGIITQWIARGIDFTAKDVRDEMKHRLEPKPVGVPDETEPPCFLAYCDELLATWEGRWSYQTYLAYRTAVEKLRCWHGEPLPFGDITPGLLRRFHTHLAKAGNARGSATRGNSANTIHKNLSTLKGFFRQAMEEEVIPWGRNPFESLDLRKQDGMKDKLSTDEIRLLRDLDLDDDSLLADVRRWFLFAFYAGGMRFSDVAHLRRKDIRTDESGQLRCFYRMGKTNSIHGVVIFDEPLAILDHFRWKDKKRDERIFPILDGYDLSSKEAVRKAVSSRNALVNKYLQKLQERAGVKTRLTFHLSRHSTAGYLLEQGYDIASIQKVLGHTTTRQTEHYLKGFKSSGPDDAVRALRL